MSLHIGQTVTAGEGILSVPNRFAPFIQNHRIVVSIQIGDMQGSEVLDSGGKHIVWGVENHFSAVGHILTQAVLEGQLFLPCAFAGRVGNALPWRIPVGAQIRSGPKHTVVV